METEHVLNSVNQTRIGQTQHYDHQALANGQNVMPNPCICLLVLLYPGLFECVSMRSNVQSILNHQTNVF